MLRPSVALSEASFRVVGAQNARRSWRTRRSVRLRLEVDGPAGVGEAAPLPGYSPDDLPSVRRALERWAVVPPTVDPDDPRGSARRALERVPAELPAARFAVETAVLDLVGRLRGEPVHALLGAHDPRPLALAGLVTGLGDAALESAARSVGRGLETLKVKIGRAGHLDDELATLERLRRPWPDVALRLDANGALPSARLDELLTAYAALEPELVEEPVSGEALGSLSRPPVPIALDESLRTVPGTASGTAGTLPGTASGPVPGTPPGTVPGTVWARLRELRCVAVVLKPAVLGGVLACLDLAREAARVEVDGRPVAAIASHLFDGPIGLQATASMALALDHPLAAGLDRGYLPADAGATPLVGSATLRPDRAGPGLDRDGADAR